MKSRLQFILVLSASCVCMPLQAESAEVFGSATDTLLRGNFAGNFPPPTFYGGSTTEGSPSVRPQPAARASVLGPPDGRYLSLPGGPGDFGDAFPGAYIEVSFGGNFGPNTLLRLYEIGNFDERAQLFIWTDTGGNVQPVIMTNPTGMTSLDLSVYSEILANMGATSFTKVGIGGRDELGPSKGFDLDAVSITPIPEPNTVALILVGLTVLGLAKRNRRY